MSEHASPIEIPEHAEQAQFIIDTALLRIKDMGYGVVADGTVYGNGVWINKLRVVPKGEQ